MGESGNRGPVLSAGLRHMLLAAFFFSLMAVLVKVAGRRLPSHEIVLARAAVTLVLSWMGLRWAGISPWGRDRPRLVGRSVFGFIALLSYFYAVTKLPLADATVIQYTSPVFTALLASATLRERVGRLEMVATLLCLVGVLLMAQPSFLFGDARTLDGFAVAVAVVGAVSASIAYVFIRSLRGTDEPLVIVFYFSLVALPATVPLLSFGGVWPVGWEWLVLLGVGVVTQLGQVHQTRGLHLEPAGRAMSVTYVQVALAFAWGILLFSELPNALGIVGALCVLAGTLVVARYRARAV